MCSQEPWVRIPPAWQRAVAEWSNAPVASQEAFSDCNFVGTCFYQQTLKTHSTAGLEYMDLAGSNPARASF